ncbi:Selenoprotein Pa [Liparis tanakae]|uniref:Selenoprotein Pa n=1 Tax=Liparis tanakae TaxID=230148 RepID=A0A4Z2FHV1_9TELE|nr:Selenoprotein Pa [Liparis tanakae]
MWACLSLLTTLCLLHGGEATTDVVTCHPPLPWRIGDVEPMKDTMGRVTVVALLHAGGAFCLVQASRMEHLIWSLEVQGFKDVAYMAINHQGEEAQQLHTVLGQRLSRNVTLYKQSGQQPDVWQTLGGEWSDFLIYDRCGRLTAHISLPYSTIGQGYVESAIKDAYCIRRCGHCTRENVETPEECAASKQPNADAPQGAQEQAGRRENHNQQGFRPQWHEQGGKVVHSQHKFELGQRQEGAYIHQIQQDAARPCEGETDTCKLMLKCMMAGLPGMAKCCCDCPTPSANVNRQHEPCLCTEALPAVCTCPRTTFITEACHCRAPPDCQPTSRGWGGGVYAPDGNVVIGVGDTTGIDVVNM